MTETPIEVGAPGAHRRIMFDGKSVTITIVTGGWASRGELKNRFRIDRIQAIENKRPARLDPTGMLTFRLSGESPELPRQMPAMSSKAPSNQFPYSKQSAAEIEALVEAIEDAMYA